MPIDTLPVRHMDIVAQRYAVAETELLDILLKIENSLALEIASVPAHSPGGMRTNTDALEAAMQQYAVAIDTIMAKDGAEWVEKWSTLSTGYGTEQVQVTLEQARLLGQTNVAQLRAAFQNFAVASGEAGIEVASGNLIGSLDGHKTDLLEFLRVEHVRAITQGIPVAGTGDTLANRLFEGGRIKALEIEDSLGRLRRISPETRAQTIARTELMSISNRTYVDQTQELGLNHYLYVGPTDSRTSTICKEVLEFAGSTPRTPEEFEARGFNLGEQHPNGRHSLVAVDPEWDIEETEEIEAA